VKKLPQPLSLSNRALVLLRLSRPEEALKDAREALRLLRSGSGSGSGGRNGSSSFSRALAAEASALNSLSRFEEAFAVADAGLSSFPGDAALAREAEVASKGMREKETEEDRERNDDDDDDDDDDDGEKTTSSLISLAADTLLLRRHEHLSSAFRASPFSLLTPSQASHDAKVRDAHSFAVVRCDEAAPARALSALGDRPRVSRWRAAVRSAVRRVAFDRGLEPALLDLGGGLFAGALSAEGVVTAAEVMMMKGEEEEEEKEEEEEEEEVETTATSKKNSTSSTSLPLSLSLPYSLPRGRAALVERWAYLADSTRDVLDANGFDAAAVRVIHARTDQVRADGRVKGAGGGGGSGKSGSGSGGGASSSSSSSSTSSTSASAPPPLAPICANVVVAAGLVDDGLLMGGIVPALRHALAELSVRGGGGEEKVKEIERGEKKPGTKKPPSPSPPLLPLLVPRAASVFACLAQISCCDPAFSQQGGEEEKENEIFDRSALRASLDSRRWAAGGFSCGAPLAPGAWRRLSKDVRVLDIDFRVLALASGDEEDDDDEEEEEEEETSFDGSENPSSSSSSSSFFSAVEVEATAPGVANAVLVWHELDLGDGGERLSSGPEEEEEQGGGGEEDEEEESSSSSSSLSSSPSSRRKRQQQQQRHRHLHPTVHWLPGGLQVRPGTPFLFKARHNTARIEVKAVLKREKEEEEERGKKTSLSALLYRCSPDLAFPQHLFAAFRDTAKLSCYFKGLKAAVICARERDGFARVLVEGGVSSGNGGGGANAAVALAAAAAGADSVLLSEPLPSTAAAARVLVSANGLAQVVKVVEGGNSGGFGGNGNGGERINVLALDVFDASLLGAGCEALARSVASRRSPFLAPKGLVAVVPARGTLWCAGVEAKCRGIGGGGSGGGSGGGGGGGGGDGSNFDDGDGGGKTSSSSSSPALLSNLSALDRYRWRPSATTVDLETEPGLRFLTSKARVWQGSFGFSEEDDGDEEEQEEEQEEEVEVEKKKKKRKQKEKRNAGSLPLTLDARAKGELTAVAFWFELDFGGGVKLSTEPSRWKEEGGEEEERKEENDDNDDGCDETEISSPSSPSHHRQRQQHHWDHSLQYLDRWCLLDPKAGSGGGGEGNGAVERKEARLVARRPRGEWGGVRVALRRAVAVAASPSSPSSSSSSRWAPRAPWLEEWGGGVSVENPHVQRSRYFDLVASDALRRAARERAMSSLGGVAPRKADDWVFAASLGGDRSGSGSDSSSSSSDASKSAALVARFAGRRPPPSIADDLSSLVAQSGSLGLDLAETAAQARRWAIAEVLAKRSSGGSGSVEVAVEAESLGARPLWLC